MFFFQSIDKFISKINNENKTNLSNLFADWLNYGTPLSIVEGLNERFKFYQKIIKGWNIRSNTFRNRLYLQRKSKSFLYIS